MALKVSTMVRGTKKKNENISIEISAPLVSTLWTLLIYYIHTRIYK